MNEEMDGEMDDQVELGAEEDMTEDMKTKLRFKFGNSEDGQSLFDYFTKDYKEEVANAQDEALEEFFIPEEEDQSGYVLGV